MPSEERLHAVQRLDRDALAAGKIASASYANLSAASTMLLPSLQRITGCCSD